MCDTSGLGDVFGFEVTCWDTLGAGCVCGTLGCADVFGLGGARGVCLGAKRKDIGSELLSSSRIPVPKPLGSQRRWLSTEDLNTSN